VILKQVKIMNVEKGARDEKHGICPRCGKRTMVAVRITGNRYTIRCTNCGTSRGLLPPDEKRSVV